MCPSLRASRRREKIRAAHVSRSRERPGCSAGMFRGEGYDLPPFWKGSFTTTLTPEMTPVAARVTWSTAAWLISPAALRAPVAAADAASSVLTPTSLAPWMAPSTAFLAAVPTSPPTAATLFTI